MINMLCKTKGDADPKDKPRIYFTCHPADFDQCFEKICNDIFKTHDCAIYYAENMNAEMAEKEKEIDIGRNHLMVIPVTYKLLTTPNRTMDSDFPYAKKEHIPVLPIMMESGLDSIYAKEAKFGELQYLYPFSNDLSEVPYEEKLKKYLDSVLISDEMGKRIRDAFAAYIFLSYRKKDRVYANELMRMIHQNPECRDIAIWFDEFLTLGESFQESIDQILNNSKLFTLLVTPNLLEEPGGKPNFVMEKEYPAAQKLGVKILPAEMIETDKKLLSEKFENLPECINVHDAHFQEQLLKAMFHAARHPEQDDAEHKFLIGLAYMDGIDVEVDRTRGLALLTEAAEAGLLEAMQKLLEMYSKGVGVALNYGMAIHWGEKIKEYCLKEYGEKHLDTLYALNELAAMYSLNGQYSKALELNQLTYQISCEMPMEANIGILIMKGNMAQTYGMLGEHQKALQIKEEIYTLAKQILSEDHPFFLLSLNNLASTLDKLGKWERALELKQKAYRLLKESRGSRHPHTISALCNLATSYYNMGSYTKSRELNEEAYQLCSEEHGEEHPDTLKCLSNLAGALNMLEMHDKAYEYNEKVYKLRAKVLGKEHVDTIVSLRNLAHSCYYVKSKARAAELTEKAYNLFCKVLGPKHTFTLSTQDNLAYIYAHTNKTEKAMRLHEKVYKDYCELYGKEYPDTLAAMDNLGGFYVKNKQYKKALAIMEELYPLQVKVFGKNHMNSLSTFDCIKRLKIVLKRS